jgi:predicted nucleic acid-binding protein
MPRRVVADSNVLISALHRRGTPQAIPRLHLLADEPDNRILECAVAAKARYIVTGDRALRALSKYRRCESSPRERSSH